MATIQLKRGQAANLPAKLAAGEPAFTTDTKTLYVGDADGNRSDINITGNAATATLASNASNATTANKAALLSTARNFSITGDVTASNVSFNGSGNVALNATLKDSGVTAGTYAKVTVDAKGRVTAGASLAASDIPTISTSKVSGLGNAATKNIGTSAGNVVAVESNGKIAETLLPAIAITDTFVVANQAAMLALTAQVGDIAIRTDLNKTFILRAAGASTLANWEELKTPSSPVQSVNGMTGAVTITNITGNAATATKASIADKLETNAGSATQPVYFSGGIPVKCTYTLGKSVPSNAVFTDTDTHYEVSMNLRNTGEQTGDTGLANISNPYLTVFENNQLRRAIQIKGSGATTVKGDDNTGILTISSTNTDTHHTAKNVVGASSGTSNAATTNGNTYLNLVENNTNRSSIKISGSGATTVSSDANGNITISSTNTTYSVATQTSNGLMSKENVILLQGLNTLVTNLSQNIDGGTF